MGSTLPTFTDLANVTQNVTVFPSAQEALVFADLTAIKAYTPCDYTKVAVVESLDGGVKHFYWNSTSTTAADDSTVIQPDAGGDGRWLIIP